MRGPRSSWPCAGFVAHDVRNREEAIEASADVDRRQFAHLDAGEVREAAVAYVDALWERDAVEDACRVRGEIDPDRVAAADWSAVESAFARRAEAAGIDPRDAPASTRGWLEHTAGGDYWTPLQRAQLYELRAALRDPTYPEKPRSGQSGYGPEPVRYFLGVELHDTRQWDEARRAMRPYFAFVLDERPD
ncbi:MAG: hypothetical protein ABEI27_14350 [Halobellus sp.]|uniref:hypothetical protein n=1 Tax=Halobellus sp. TaxID=1979212 RepID=UPI0035D3F88A